MQFDAFLQDQIVGINWEKRAQAQPQSGFAYSATVAWRPAAEETGRASRHIIKTPAKL